jgi:hypothetical protein
MADGSPIYEVSSLPSATRVPVLEPVTHPDDDAEYAHRVRCLPCLFNSLVEPMEEFDEFASNTATRILEIDAALPAARDEHLLELRHERAHRVNELALSSQAIAAMRALIHTASKFLL